MNNSKELLGRDILPRQVVETVELIVYWKEYFDDYQFGEDFILTYSFYNTINLILKSYGIDKTYDGELPPKCYEQIFDFIIENIEDCVIELDE